MNRMPTFVYALRRESPGGWRILRGRAADVHKSLLTRCRWLTAFGNAPDDFIMGRIRVFPGRHVVVVDTVSDMYQGKTGRVSSLPDSPIEAEALLAAVRAEFPEYHVFLIAAPARVPAMNEKRLEEALSALPGRPESGDQTVLALHRSRTEERAAKC